MIESVQKLQLRILNATYRNRNRSTPSFAFNQALTHWYRLTVCVLEALLPKDAHCFEVDIEMWYSFSDWYKFDTNLRPTGHFTRSSVMRMMRRYDPGTVFETNGYLFAVQTDGTVTDGDLSFASVEDFCLVSEDYRVVSIHDVATRSIPPVVKTALNIAEDNHINLSLLKGVLA